MRTVLAALDMTAERRGAANLDCCHDTPLGQADMTLVGGTPGSAEAAEESATSGSGRDMQSRSVGLSISITNGSSGL
jgi:hypothetical protein